LILIECDNNFIPYALHAMGHESAYKSIGNTEYGSLILRCVGVFPLLINYARVRKKILVRGIIEFKFKLYKTKGTYTSLLHGNS